MPQPPSSLDWLTQQRTVMKAASVEQVAQQRLNMLYRVTPLISPLGPTTRA
jgi:hypothetical protein